MKHKPDISFITVNFNGYRFTVDLIKSIIKFLPQERYEIIVVDNGSNSNESEIIKTEIPSIITLRSNKNLGFSGGNNLGISVSSGRYLMLINNDTLLVDDSILKLVDFMDLHPKVGAVSPKIYFYKPGHTIQFAGYTDLTEITLRNSMIGFNEIDKGQYSISSQTSFTHGAAMMVRREVVENVGLMPEIFFLYYEELDWCQKMKNYGYEIWYVHDSLVVHKESQSVGSGSPLKTYYLTRNRILYIFRNRKGITKIVALMYQYLIALPKSFFISIIKRRPDLVLASLKGALDVMLLNDKYK